jgi:hypothetical protein
MIRSRKLLSSAGRSLSDIPVLEQEKREICRASVPDANRGRRFTETPYNSVVIQNFLGNSTALRNRRK